LKKVFTVKVIKHFLFHDKGPSVISAVSKSFLWPV